MLGEVGTEPLAVLSVWSQTLPWGGAVAERKSWRTTGEGLVSEGWAWEGQGSLLWVGGVVGAGTRWVIVVWGLLLTLTRFIPAPRPQSCICEKGLACPAPQWEGRQRGGHPGFAPVTRVTWLCFSGLQFVRWRLQYYLPGVVLMRTGLDTNTGKAHS